MAVNNSTFTNPDSAPVVYDAKKIDRLLANSNLNTSGKFSPAETFQLKAEWYSNMGENDLSKVYWDLANSLWQYSDYANATIWAYTNLLNYMTWNERWLQELTWKTYNTLLGDINEQKNYVNSVFGPEGKLTKEIDTYYDDLWNYLATDAGRQAATIAAQWMHSWASLWAIRAQQNQAYNESFARYVQAKEQQINAKTNVATSLINFMSALRKEYWDSTNEYIIEIYKRMADLYNNTALSLWQDINNLAKLKFASSWSGWGSSLSDLLSALGLINSSDSDSNSGGGIVKWEGDNKSGGNNWLGNATSSFNLWNLLNLFNPFWSVTSRLWLWSVWELISNQAALNRQNEIIKQNEKSMAEHNKNKSKSSNV